MKKPNAMSIQIQNTDSQDEIVTPQRKRWWLILSAGVLLVIAVSIAAKPLLSDWYHNIPSFPEDDVVIATVTRGDLIRDVAVTGRLVAANAPQLFSTEAGLVSFAVRPGEKVKLGEMLATIDSPALNAEIAQAQSLLKKLQAELGRGELNDEEAALALNLQKDEAAVRLTAAQRESERASLLYDKQLISQLDFVEKQDILQEAKLFHQHAQNKIVLTNKRLAFEAKARELAVQQQQLHIDELLRRQHALQILSPVNGVVGSWLVEQQERVNNGQALMTVVDLSHYEAELSVPEFYADELAPGLSAEINISGKEIKGEVRAISAEVVNSQVQVMVALQNYQDLSLRQNQRLNARLHFEYKPNVLMLKRGQFLQSRQANTVYIVENQLARQRDITMGAASVEFIQIVAGLHDGERVIISKTDLFGGAPLIRLSN